MRQQRHRIVTAFWAVALLLAAVAGAQAPRWQPLLDKAQACAAPAAPRP
jgi:hypothetical protein